MDIDILDQTKENVQPLRKGRRADQLGTVLQAKLDDEAQHELNQQRKQYELAILNYDGDDPLQPRYEFVHWIEQSYPSLGPESKFSELLEDTIMLYKDCSQYRQDQRFAKILVKYINLQINPLELYKMAYNQGLTTMCAIFYLSWAEELEKNSNWKKANKVYEIGIMNHAEPLAELKRRHEQFQLSVGRNILIGDMNSNDSPEKSTTIVAPPRQALSKLHKSSIFGPRVSKGNVGILQAVPSTTGNNQRRTVTVFEDENEGNFPYGNSKTSHFSKSKVVNKENTLKAGPWKKSSSSTSSRSRSNALSSALIASVPKFEVHEDEEIKEPSLPTPIVTRALKSIKVENPSNAILESIDDPNIKFMYPKHKIYVGGCEFQLEELKAAAYYKKHNITYHDTELGCGLKTPMIFRNESSRKVPSLYSTPFITTPYVTNDPMTTPSKFEPPTLPPPKTVSVRLFANED